MPLTFLERWWFILIIIVMWTSVVAITLLIGWVTEYIKQHREDDVDG